MTEVLKPSAETSTENDDDTTESGSSSSSKKAVKSIGKVTAGQALRPQEAPVKQESKVETLWQKLLVDRKEKNTEPEVVSPSQPQPAPEELKSDATSSKEIGSQELESDEDLPLDEMRLSERHMAARKYIEPRKDQLQAELASQTDETSSPQAVETALDLALLQSMEEKLAADPDASIESVLDDAEAETVAMLDLEASRQPDEAGPSAPGHPGEESPEETAAQEAISAADSDEDRPAAATPLAGARGNGSAGAVPPPPPLNPASPGGPFGPGGYYGPGGPGMGASGGNTAPGLVAAANVAPVAVAVSAANVLGNERAAMGQGLLIGGIVGYLVGRRRGRIKTEKKLIPIQKKLEKEVQGLHDMIAAKEQKIRTLAAERATPAASQNLVTKVREKILPSGAAESAKPGPVERRDETKRPNAFEIPLQHTERLGRLLVEAPGTVMAGAVTAATVAAEVVRGKPAEQAPLIRFDKNIELFTSQELAQAAEKVKIEGVSLKEMRDANSINESGMKRVMAEFLRGGNVKAALAKELTEKDLTYERDPQFRQAQPGVASGLAGVATAAAGLAAVSATVSAPFNADPTGTSDSGATSRPVPDAATLKALRNRQMAGVATTTIVVGAIITLLIAMLG